MSLLPVFQGVDLVSEFQYACLDSGGKSVSSTDVDCALVIRKRVVSGVMIEG